MSSTLTMQRFKMGFSDYIQALEQERRKIQVFPKELPLSLELVTQGTLFVFFYVLSFIFLFLDIDMTQSFNLLFLDMFFFFLKT